MTEARSKLEKIRALMARHQIEGLRLKGVDWFSWVTCGGSSVVIFTSETGVAEVLITLKNAWVLTSRIERDRLVDEEVPKEFEVVSFPWEEPEAFTRFASSTLGGKVCASDRPTHGEQHLPADFQRMRASLLPDEISRYRKVGRLATEAMTEALSLAEPDWSEDRLAGEGANSLWSRGLDPALVMVGGEKRAPIYRHPVATAAPLGRFAMMVFCARAFGLYANLTRFIFFREPTEAEAHRFETVAKIEAAVLDKSVPGQSLRQLYQTLARAYAELGFPEQIHHHHQGGPTGYLSREQVAGPDSPADWKIENKMALAWNPSLPGAKIEDTVLVTDKGIEILTQDSRWPVFEVAGRPRPRIWIRK